MEKAYTPIGWKNGASGLTPINADNLNKMEKGIDDVDDRVVAMNDRLEVFETDYYEGVDLKVKFADEIAEWGNPWSWIKQRIFAGNFAGIRVGDYIPITCTNENAYTFTMQVAGINTYKGVGNDNVRNHIDFISKELWPDAHCFNKVAINNGNIYSANPFLASDLNYWMNSLAGEVPNSTTDMSVTTAVDYTTDGILYYLPDEVKNHIIGKTARFPIRYTAGSTLTADNNATLLTTEKLWIPSEFEVSGSRVFGSTGRGVCGFVQYPLFMNGTENRLKKRVDTGTYANYWLMSAYNGAKNSVCEYHASGMIIYDVASVENIRVPICFRVGV